MARASKVVRRSAVKLFAGTQKQYDFIVAVEEWQDIVSLAKHLSKAHHAAGEQLTQWSRNESNVAIRNISGHCQQLLQMASVVQDSFAKKIREAVQEFEVILEGEKRLHGVEKEFRDLEDKLKRLQKEVKNTFGWRKGGTIRLLEHQIDETIRARDSLQQHFEQLREDHERTKAQRFKQFLLRHSEAYMELGRALLLIFETQRDIAQLVPDTVTQDNVQEDAGRSTQFSGEQQAQRSIALLRQRVRESAVDFSIAGYGPPPPYSPHDSAH